MDFVAGTAAILLLIALGWAALERGRVHRHWARMGHRVRNDTTTALIFDWCLSAGEAAAGWL